MASAVETHPQRKQILDAILAGQSPQKIAAWCKPPLHFTTIWRYSRKAVKPAMDSQAAVVDALQQRGLLVPDANRNTAVSAIRDATVSVLAADPILAQVAEQRGRRERMMAMAEESKDVKAFAAVDRNQISSIELEAKLCGRLTTAADQRTVVIVVPPGSTHQASLPDAMGEGPVIDITPE